MGLLCSIWGHSDEAQNLLDKDGNFTLFKCRRCKREMIHCGYEGEMLDNDDEGRRIMTQMQKDPEFSKQCHIHWRFIQAETESGFSYEKQDKKFEEIRKEFGLPPGYRQPNPIILFKKGLWKPKAENHKVEKKSRPKKGEQLEKASIASQPGKKVVGVKKSKLKLSEGDKLKLLREKLDNLVRLEKFEEAARIRDEINNMSSSEK
jgi:hypothetical protein